MSRRIALFVSFSGLLAAIGLFGLMVSCASSPPPVSLSSAWPQTAPPLDDAGESWTRQAQIREFGAEILTVYATFKSPAWRAAYVDYLATTQRLPANKRAELVAAQREASSSAHEVMLMVTTHDRRENDLDKGERSIWRLALVDDQGNEVEPMEVIRDRRPAGVIRAEYPELGDFAVPYIVRFPPTLAVLRDDASRFSLKMSSPRGLVEMVWQAAP